MIVRNPIAQSCVKATTAFFPFCLRLELSGGERRRFCFSDTAVRWPEVFAFGPVGGFYLWN